MSHAAEGSLQAYLDGEMDSAAASALSHHVASCTACAAELDGLRGLHGRAHGALAVLDAPPQTERAHALVTARTEQRRLVRRRLIGAGSFGLAKAAMLLIALAGASAAIIPGSPLRDALENAFARVFGPREAPTTPPAQEPVVTAPVEVQDFRFAASDNRVRIVLRAPTGTVLVRVRGTDETVARIETEQAATVSVVSAPGRAELRNVANAILTISIPRSVPNAAIEIDGVVYVSKQGGTLQRVGRRDTSSPIRFEIEN
ncbi:MAG TPA: zf-HC2 domain-containing protein [Longimicrobiales bacterium]|nr:zf-HC2 domain-containing protein [Longimicrobiales bacterium]